MLPRSVFKSNIVRGNKGGTEMDKTRKRISATVNLKNGTEFDLGLKNITLNDAALVIAANVPEWSSMVLVVVREENDE